MLENLEFLKSLQFGFDIATSISIIGAAISFLVSQKKTREQQKRQYAVSNLKEFILYIKNKNRNYKQIINETRMKFTELVQKGKNKDPRENQSILIESNAKIITFLEELMLELKSQNSIYFPIFSPSHKAPKALLDMEERLKQLIDKAKKFDNNIASVVEEMETFMTELEKSAAKELIKIIDNG